MKRESRCFETIGGGISTTCSELSCIHRMEEGISLGRWLMFTGSKGVWRTPGIAVTCGKEFEHLCDRARRRDVEEEVNNSCFVLNLKQFLLGGLRAGRRRAACSRCNRRSSALQVYGVTSRATMARCHLRFRLRSAPSPILRGARTLGHPSRASCSRLWVWTRVRGPRERRRVALRRARHAPSPRHCIPGPSLSKRRGPCAACGSAR